MYNEPLMSYLLEQEASGVVSQETVEERITSRFDLRGLERLWRKFVSHETIASVIYASAALAFNEVTASNPMLPVNEAFTNWGKNALLPIALYYGVRASCQGWLLDKGFSLKFALGVGAAIFLGGSALELAQKYSFYPGTYDPYDFAVNAVGVGLAVAADKASFGRNSISKT